MLLVDADNTLVDRASAFNRWATDFIGSLGGTEADADWLIAADRDGYEPREALARSIKGRFKINASVSTLIQSLLYEHVDHLTMDSTTAGALHHARVAGYAIGIVTNGTTLQQNLKIQTVGLEAFVDCVVVSESAGFRKPDPAIFRLAARNLGTELAGAGWLVTIQPLIFRVVARLD